MLSQKFKRLLYKETWSKQIVRMSHIYHVAVV